jgi:hypothetical protein
MLQSNLIEEVLKKHKKQLTKWGFMSPTGLKYNLIYALLLEAPSLHRVYGPRLKNTLRVHARPRWTLSRIPALLGMFPILQNRYGLTQENLLALKQAETTAQTTGTSVPTMYNRWLETIKLPPADVVQDPYWFFK